jgi:hypothetical protein
VAGLSEWCVVWIMSFFPSPKLGCRGRTVFTQVTSPWLSSVAGSCEPPRFGVRCQGSLDVVGHITGQLTYPCHHALSFCDSVLFCAASVIGDSDFSVVNLVFHWVFRTHVTTKVSSWLTPTYLPDSLEQSRWAGHEIPCRGHNSPPSVPYHRPDESNPHPQHAVNVTPIRPSAPRSSFLGFVRISVSSMRATCPTSDCYSVFALKTTFCVLGNKQLLGTSLLIPVSATKRQTGPYWLICNDCQAKACFLPAHQGRSAHKGCCVFQETNI